MYLTACVVMFFAFQRGNIMDNLTFDIPEFHVDQLQAKIAEVNRRAVKLGCPVVELIKVGEYQKTRTTKTGYEYKLSYVQMQVTGKTPKLNGWELIAVVEPLESGENLVKTVPGKAFPEELQAGSMACDHCHTDRRRKQVFIVRHEDGQYRKVGRNCLSDFLGGHSPESILHYFEIIKEVESIGDGDEDSFWGGSGQRAVDPIDFLSLTRAIARRFGWVSRANAGPEAMSTADMAWQTINWPNSGLGKDVLEEIKNVENATDVQFATDALAWGKEQQGSDYLANLGVACRNEIVRRDTCGLIASLVSSYSRHLEKQRETAAKVPTKHVGTVGERENFKVRILSVIPTEGAFGATFVVKMQDEQANVLTWFASSEPGKDLPQNELIEIVATVKAHKEFRDVPQTIITRVKRFVPKVKKGKKQAEDVKASA